ncbi:CCA tRNA nucleotidyltransferase [bacterium]|nr:CCA tRNA nucleotidyltransferase [bacterium]
MRELVAAGFAAYRVGGCVRDRLRGVPPGDIDVATNAPLDRITALFPSARIVGEAFGVALVDGIEVATFRQDGPYSDFRHPDYVTRVSTIEEDLARRDFTVNAIAEDLTGTIIDPFHGRQDLEAARIRFVGDARQRLREDPIRALRACRFAALIGGTLDEAARTAIEAGRHLLEKVPRERIQLELNKMLMLDDREAALLTLSGLNLLPHVLPALARSIGVPQEGHHAEDCWVHAVKTVQAVRKESLPLRLAALVHDIAKPHTRMRGEDGIDHFYQHETLGERLVETELQNLRYSGDTIAYVKEAVRHHLDRIMFRPEMKDATIRRHMSALQHLPVRDLLRLQLADLEANLAEPYTRAERLDHLRYALRRIRAIEAQAHALRIADLAIDGRDVMQAFHLPPGPAVGRALALCFERVLQQPQMNTRSTLLGLLHEQPGWRHAAGTPRNNKTAADTSAS